MSEEESFVTKLVKNQMERRNMSEKEEISHDHRGYFNGSHATIDHIIEGTPREMAMNVLSRHLCGWITGHSAPLEHFLIDAGMLLEDMETFGLKVVRDND